jgi:hypothetical protein
MKNQRDQEAFTPRNVEHLFKNRSMARTRSHSSGYQSPASNLDQPINKLIK